MHRGVQQVEFLKGRGADVCDEDVCLLQQREELRHVGLCLDIELDRCSTRVGSSVATGAAASSVSVSFKGGVVPISVAYSQLLPNVVVSKLFNARGEERSDGRMRGVSLLVRVLLRAVRISSRCARYIRRAICSRERLLFVLGKGFPPEVT